MKRRLVHIFTVLLCMLFIHLQAQVTPAKKPPVKRKFLNNIFKRVVSSVTVSKEDSAAKAAVLYSKSERPYTEYEGKVIRKIKIEELGFEKIFTDTTKIIQYKGTQILNSLHTDTYDWVIRDNLFIKEGTRLNSFQVADNERYLRSLEFIQDARILAKPIRGTKDSVDLLVVTKDLFTITGSIELSSSKRQKFQLAEKNLAGAGQKVQLTALMDKRRHPGFGYDFLYTKNSVLHSFINASAGYSKIVHDRQGDEAVSSLYVQLDRPLVSMYSRIAGGFLMSFNKSTNAFQRPESDFYNYQDVYADVWAGYNIGVKKLITDHERLTRTFVAARYFNDNFSKVPYQIGNSFDPFFNSRKAVLLSLTLFRQQFTKTNFIYGFGTTEDVPYGYNISLTSGWYKHLSLSRPYIGVNINRYYAGDKGDFMQAFLRIGSFPNKVISEDGSILAGGSYYSPLKLIRNMKQRDYLRLSVTKLFNRLVYDPLRIDNSLGLQGFSADSLRGTQRVSVYAERFLFLKYKLLGFQLAPFAFVDASLLTGEKERAFKSGLFTGIGGGIRTRNENFVFGTIELRFEYFPRTVEDINSFRVSLRSNLRFRYNSSYVRAPDIIQLNNDDENNVY